VTLANEKVYRPYLLIQKKNYAAMKYTLKGGHKADSLASFDLEMDMKGIDAVRRDRSKLVKSISENILQALLVKQDLSGALAGLQADLALVSSQQAPLDWFVLSKSLKGSYKSQNQPHVQAWKRMIARGDSDIPEIGTRMPYVITQPTMATTGPIYLRTEHPAFVIKNKIKYDSKYYLDNAQDVVERLLRPTGQQQKVAQIFIDALEQSEAKSSGSMSLLKFKKLKTI
jgi:DNA polymerase elongation subunit (family B)